jgi:hypothetical protein
MAAVPDPARSKDSTHARQELRDRGVGLFAIFSAAVLFMVVAIVVVGYVDTWWVLAPVMLIDFAVTIGVLSGIARLLSDDGD